MARQKNAEVISSPLGIHELQLALIREMAAYHDWDLRIAARELQLMRRICAKTSWADRYQPLVDDLTEAIKVTAKTVRDKDTTLITSSHTQLEHAVFALRDKLYA